MEAGIHLSVLAGAMGGCPSGVQPVQRSDGQKADIAAILSHKAEKAGVISRYVAVLDQDRVGLPVSVFVSIKLEKQGEKALEQFARTTANWPEVLECYLMTGPRDYLMRVVAPISRPMSVS
jgi:hypothetical protein